MEILGKDKRKRKSITLEIGISRGTVKERSLNEEIRKGIETDQTSLKSQE
jgi:hypothetical protein